MAISASFHKNVFLLVQLVPASDEFKKHFREGMFDKPNTNGFVHVSHYLLTIYDAERFKKAVQWPIICKKTETKFRRDVKDYLSTLSAENPDFGFPPILASYLLHAAGTKFTTVMWKLSQLVLCTYLKQQDEAKVLMPSKQGVVEDLTKTLLNNIITSTNACTTQLHNDYLEQEKEARIYTEEEVEETRKIHLELFERKHVLADVVSIAPASPLIKKQLIDTEDYGIIELWRKSIQENLEDLQERHKCIREVESLCNEVANMISNILSDSKILDTNALPEVNINIVSKLSWPPETQVLFHRLYNEKKLVLRNLLSLFNSVLHQLWRILNNNRLSDLCGLNLQVKASCEDMRSMCNLFYALIEKVTKAQYSLQKDSNRCATTTEEKVGIDIDNVLLLPSPVLQINTNSSDYTYDIQNRFELTPTEGMHRTLFSRHKRNEGVTPQSTRPWLNPVVSRINFDDTILSTLPKRALPRKRGLSSRLNMSINKSEEKYSRLFSSYVKKSNKANLSAMSVASCSKANSTALVNVNGEVQNVAELSLDATLKSFYSLSREVVETVSGTPTAEKYTPKKQNNSNVIRKASITFSGNESNVKMTESRIDESTDLEAKDSPKFVKPEGNVRKQSRRSISDLVERYKKLLENSNTVSTHLETSETNSEKDE